MNKKLTPEQTLSRIMNLVESPAFVKLAKDILRKSGTRKSPQKKNKGGSVKRSKKK